MPEEEVDLVWPGILKLIAEGVPQAKGQPEAYFRFYKRKTPDDPRHDCEGRSPGH
jgi:hypothetical protein